MFRVLLLIICANLESVIHSKLSIFDMGQGSCQLNTYHLSNDGAIRTVGMMYDCGSVTGTNEGDEKVFDVAKDINATYISKEEMKKIVKEAKEKEDKSAKYQKLEELVDKHLQSKRKKNSERKDQIKRAEEVEKEKRNKIKAEKAKIVEEIKKLTHLIVFLSHPDEDHINEIKGFVSDAKNNVKLMSFLCGNWEKSEKVVRIAKIFLLDNGIVFEPKSLKSNGKEGGFFSGDLKDLFDLTRRNNEDPGALCDLPDSRGGFDELLLKIQSLGLSTNVTNSIKQLENMSYISEFARICDELKDYVYIWSMNNEDKNNIKEQNEASPIISFTHEYMGLDSQTRYTSIICTGDAEYEYTYIIEEDMEGKSYTRESIMKESSMYKKYCQNALRKKVMRIEEDFPGLFILMKSLDPKKAYIGINSIYDDPHHDIILVVPHHGSQKQISAAESLYSVFKPSLVYCSNKFQSYGNNACFIQKGFFDVFVAHRDQSILRNLPSIKGKFQIK